MGKFIEYCFVEEVHGKYLEENGDIYFKTDSLSNLPAIGDALEFTNNEYGPSGSYAVTSRTIETGSLDVSKPMRVTIFVCVPG
jgi:hypothetical protein